MPPALTPGVTPNEVPIASAPTSPLTMPAVGPVTPNVPVIPGVQPTTPTAPGAPVSPLAYQLVRSVASYKPELGESISTAQQRNCDRMAIQIISMMENPW